MLINSIDFGLNGNEATIQSLILGVFEEVI